MKLIIFCTLLSTFVSAQQQLPSLPTRYHTAVAANILNNGYTVGWEEWYDGSVGMLRADGRFDDPTNTQIVNISASLLYQFPTAAFSNCNVYNVSLTGRGSFFSGPVTNFFLIFNASNNFSTTTYMGQQASSRGILANIFQSVYYRQQLRGNNTIVTSYTAVQEWTIPSSMQPSIPLSVQLDGYMISPVNGTMLLRNYSHHYTFLKWQVGDIPASTFAVPSSCVPSGTVPNRFTRSYTSQIQSQLSVVPFPPIPNAFSSFVEVKIEQPPTSTSQYELTTPKWNFYYDYNPLLRSERIDYYNTVTTLNDVVIWNYQPVDANTFGRTISNIGGACSYSTIPSFLSSPLSTIRAGFVPELFANSGSYSFGQYQGRSSVRGVPADNWLISFLTRSVQNADGTTSVYNFNATVYFYPQGWQFPSRGYSNGFEPPLRVVLSGTYSVNGGATTTYSDIWDFAYFLQLIPSTSLFQAQLICPTAPTGTLYPSTCPAVSVTSVNNSNYNSAVGAAVFFGLFSGILMGFLLYKYCKGRLARGQTTDHKQLNETTV